jgi:hypothetical protein
MSWFVPPNCTDVVQVVDDARVGKVLKDLVREERDAYIEAAGWKEYESLDAPAKRVMFSHFAGEAWRRYTEEDKYKKMLHESFLAKGFLPVDGSMDFHLNLGAGMEGVTFPQVCRQGGRASGVLPGPPATNNRLNCAQSKPPPAPRRLNLKERREALLEDIVEGRTTAHSSFVQTQADEYGAKRDKAAEAEKRKAGASEATEGQQTAKVGFAGRITPGCSIASSALLTPLALRRHLERCSPRSRRPACRLCTTRCRVSWRRETQQQTKQQPT